MRVVQCASPMVIDRRTNRTDCGHFAAHEPSTVYTVIISEKGGQERRGEFEQAQVSIGRARGNDLVLAKGNVSKHHCQIERVDSGFVVTDQNSTNGTYVNRRRISTPTTVRPGDRVYVGDFVLSLELDALQPAPGVLAAENLLSVAPPDDDGAASRPSLAPVPRTTSPDMEAVVEEVQSPTSTGPQQLSAEPVAASGATISMPVGPAADRISAVTSFAEWICERVLARLNAGALDGHIVPELRTAVQQHILNAAETLAAETTLDEHGIREAKDLVADELLDLGPLTKLLQDPKVTEIAVSGAGYLLYFRGQGREEAQYPLLLEESAQRIAARLCRREGVELAAEGAAVVMHRLRQLGFDLRLVRCGDDNRNSLLRLLRTGRLCASLEDLARDSSISRTMEIFLRHCVAARVNILVVGPHRGGTAELMSALAGAVKGERAIAILNEDDIRGPRGEVRRVSSDNRTDLAPLLLEASALPRHRLLVDGLRRETSSALLQAISEGADGVFASLRARSIERGVSRLCAELGMSSKTMGASVAADSIVGCFDIGIEVARFRDGKSRVLRICELERADRPPVLGRDIFKFTVERTTSGGAIEGNFHPTGRSPRLAEELRARGTRLDANLFGVESN